MIFRLLIILMAFAIPLGVYYIYWRLIFSKDIQTEYQKIALTMAFAVGFLCTIGFFIYLTFADTPDNGDQFFPATLDENGHIIKSHTR